MPLSKRAQVRVIYAECNSPAAGTQDGTPGYLFDTFYDKAQDAIDPGDVDAALAELGLTYDPIEGKFHAIAPSTWSLTADLDIDPAPGGACTVLLHQRGWSWPTVIIPDPNTLPHTILHGAYVQNVGGGDDFGLRSTCTNGTDTPITYAALSIVRLV